jgi:Fe2+ or Zn2+ uptake regulation protein
MNRSVQRDAILNDLRSLKTHPTAEDLYKRLRPRMPKISIGTVYRNLEQLSVAGIIRKLELSDRLRRFDGDLSPHFHRRCCSCGAVSDVPAERLDALFGELAAAAARHSCSGYHVEFTGVCGECRSNLKKEEN